MSFPPFILPRLTVVWPRADAAVQSVVDPCNIFLYLYSKNLYLHSISHTSCNKYNWLTPSQAIATAPYSHQMAMKNEWSDWRLRTSLSCNTLIVNTVFSYKMVPKRWIIRLWWYYEIKHTFDDKNNKGGLFLVVFCLHVVEWVLQFPMINSLCRSNEEKNIALAMIILYMPL